MRLEVDAQLGRLRGGVTGLESYALPGNGRAIGGQGDAWFGQLVGV